MLWCAGDAVGDGRFVQALLVLPQLMRPVRHGGPVGEASRGYLIMCMGSGGHVYGGYDDFLVRLGTSGDDAIEGLCTGREAPQVD